MAHSRDTGAHLEYHGMIDEVEVLLRRIPKMTYDALKNERTIIARKLDTLKAALDSSRAAVAVDGRQSFLAPEDFSALRYAVRRFGKADQEICLQMAAVRRQEQLGAA